MIVEGFYRDVDDNDEWTVEKDLFIDRSSTVYKIVNTFSNKCCHCCWITLLYFVI